jgi:hypothetical protein
MNVSNNILNSIEHSLLIVVKILKILRVKIEATRNGADLAVPFQGDGFGGVGGKDNQITVKAAAQSNGTVKVPGIGVDGGNRASEFFRVRGGQIQFDPLVLRGKRHGGKEKDRHYCSFHNKNPPFKIKRFP